jgi:hypothetical protein
MHQACAAVEKVCATAAHGLLATRHARRSAWCVPRSFFASSTLQLALLALLFGIAVAIEVG